MKDANTPIVIDSQDTVDDVVVVEDRVEPPKKKRKLKSSSPVVILDESDEEKTTKTDNQDHNLPITKLKEKVKKLETVKEISKEINRPEILLKDLNDNKDCFGARRKPNVPED